MRKLLCTSIFILAALFCAAQQPQKGTILIGGGIFANVEKDTYKDDLSGNTSEANFVLFGLNPRAGYTLFNGFMVGVSINYSVNRFKFASTKNVGYQIQGGPFVRYYLPIGFFAEINFGAGLSSSKTVISGSSGGSSVDLLLSGFAGAGFAYFVNDYISIEPLIGFGLDQARLENDDVSTQRGLRFRLSIVAYIPQNGS